jgi:hypothetical protein
MSRRGWYYSPSHSCNSVQHRGQDQRSHGAPAVEELLLSNRGQEGIAVELDLVFFEDPGGSHAGTVTTGRSSSEGVLDLSFEVRRTGVDARSIEPDSFLRRGVQDGPVRPHAVAALEMP